MSNVINMGKRLYLGSRIDTISKTMYWFHFPWQSKTFESNHTIIG